MTNDTLANDAAQLDFFGCEQVIDSASAIAAPAVDDDHLPLMLMRHAGDGSTWRGPGVWCHLHWTELRSVRGLDAHGKRSSDVPSVMEPGPTGRFAWYPTVGAAEREALERHHGPVTRAMPEVRVSDPGLFAWCAARGWALGVAGYTVDVWDNGAEWLLVTDDAMAAVVRMTSGGGDPVVGEFVSLSYLAGDSFDELLRRRGLDPDGA